MTKSTNALKRHFTCRDCGCDVMSRAEFYMVHDEIWAQTGIGPDGMLCLDDLARRLGRPLRRDDFVDAPVNRVHREAFR